MKNKGVLTCAGAVLLLGIFGALAGAGTYTNPVIQEIGPADPTVIRFKGTYYLPALTGTRMEM